jgi:hypothetical protein
MVRIPTRIRVMTLLTTALLTGGLVASAVPAQALTWDHDRTNSLHFTVAGKRYQLSEVAIGQQQTTVHVGQHTGTVWSHWRITIKDNHRHVLKRVDRHLYKETAIFAAFGVVGFRTVKAFRAAEHRALTITGARANTAYFKGLRLESIDADQETNVGQVIDYLDTLPAGAEPDFNAVTVIHSNEYRGSVTVSGSDAKHWSIIVRDAQDGVGSFYDSATGAGTRFSI